VSATHLRGEALAITVHGTAELRQAMLDHYLPLQGRAFEEWEDEEDPIGARISAEKMFTFRL